MSRTELQKEILLPPFRPGPESARRIMRTQLTVLMLPVLAALYFQPVPVLRIILPALLTAALTDLIIHLFRQNRYPGDTAHSLLIGLMLALTLPVGCVWYIPAAGALMAVLLGKYLWGGSGRYIWHPALLGRVLVQLLFTEQIHMALTAGTASPSPLYVLHNLDGLSFGNFVPQLGLYMYNHLPPLEQCLWGVLPGGLGESHRLLLILIGLYFIYRGYLHWQLPLIFIATAYVCAGFFPIPLQPDGANPELIFPPIMAENLSVGITYMNYHLFTGGLILTAFILTSDMTSRPLTVRGQVYLACGAGVLTMLIRLYCPERLYPYIGPIPAYTAYLALTTFVPVIDRLIRPRAHRKVQTTT